MGFLIVQTHETPAVIVNLIKGLDYEYFVMIKDQFWFIRNKLVKFAMYFQSGKTPLILRVYDPQHIYLFINL